MRTRFLLTTTGMCLLAAVRLGAVDKNGVSPHAISLPSGPGSIQGLGESFQPQLNTGSGRTGLQLVLPKGPGGIVAELSLAYDSGSGNGGVGLGWSLSGMLSIRRSTDRGVPLYVDGPDGVDNDADAEIDNAEELDTFTGANGEELVTLGDGSFRAENESAFLRYRRSGAGWEARSRDGRQYLFGTGAAARMEDAGRVFEWCLERVTDPNGNTIEYEYESDPQSAAQKHLRRVRWGGAQAYVGAVLSYEEGRPDVVTSYRSGFELRTSVRLSGIDVISHGIPAAAAALRGDLDGDASADALIRRYRLEYREGAHLSLLEQVTQLGQDGVTALPTLTYGYTSWTPPDSVAATVIRSRGAPAEGFDSPSVELIDMNGDGLPDLLTTAGSQHRVYTNRGVDAEGRLVWAPGRPVGNAPTIDISSDRTHLADATADGLSDLMVKVSNTSFLCFDNTAESSWTTAPFPISNTDTWPIWPHDGAGGAQSRSFDSDYNRHNDVLHTAPTGNQLWLLLRSGRYSRELRFPPLVAEGQAFRFDLPGTHIADLNGDRLQDLAWIQASRVVYFPNRGRGSFAAPIILPLGRTLSAAEIERSDFSDIDGDGLVDLTVVRPTFLPNGVVYWLNRFDAGLDGPHTVLGLPAQRTGDALRWADMNGNGTTDIVISQAQSAAGEKILVVDLVPEGKPFLLRRADNGLGRVIHMGYESSTAQMVRAEAAAQPWATRMPVPITVVGKITEEVELSPPFVQTITYRDPYYDPAKQEFRGFASAENREEGDQGEGSVPAKRTRFVFDTGREEACLKGKELSQEILGADGTLFERTETLWGTRVLAMGVDGRSVCYAFGAAQNRRVHEGEPVGIQLRSETDYDDFGNAIAERRLGIADVPGDEVVTRREYEIRVAAWRLNLLSRETTEDGAGHVLADRRHAYDARGNLVRTELWLEGEGRFVVAERRVVDAFGNVVEKTDARGSRRTIAHDALLHAWPTVETLHLAGGELAMTATYDLGLGVVTDSVSFSGEEIVFVYDALGRLIEKRRPGGATETYRYELGRPWSRITKRGLEDGGGTLDSLVFYDGLGRELFTKLEAGEGLWRVVGARRFNPRKLEARKWLPFMSSSDGFELPNPQQPHSTFSYDPPGRLVDTEAPDGSHTRTVHRPLEVHELGGVDDAAGGGADVKRRDGLDRLVEVEERNGAETYLTRYRWNARGELETVTDALQNVKTFRFDTLGRLLEVDDPDRGLQRTAYDDVGNLVERLDPRGRRVTFVYDEVNRPLEKVYRGGGPGGADLVATRWHYDLPAGVLDFGDGTSGTARNTAGHLAYAEDLSGETHFSYDERGNVEWTLKRVREATTGLLVPYRTQRSHDLLDRNVAIVFPDNDVLRFEHGAGSFVTGIRGEGPEAGVILSDAEYSASGKPLVLAWGNGVTSRLDYDASDRLLADQLLGPGGAIVRQEELTYDLDSNLVAVEDLRPQAAVPASSPRRTTARYDFDELHRLVRASFGSSGAAGIISYRYDALGNLLEQSTPAAGQPGHIADPAVQLGVVSYQGGRNGRHGRRPGDLPGPHAITATASGHTLGYDAGGNVTRHGQAELAWDFEDRLERYSTPGSAAQYVHDHTGARVVRKVVAAAGANEEIWHIDPASEVRQDGTLVKYAFLDGRRVARFQGSMSPGRERVQTLRLAPSWNLVAAAVETPLTLRGAFGADASVYEASGASYVPVQLSAALAAGQAFWVHVPSARRVALRGPAHQPEAGAPSASLLHAWPRLESFHPALDLEGAPSLQVFDAAARRWLRRDPSLPAFLSDAPAELGSAQAFWSPGPVRFRAAAASPRSVVYYHADAVGSVAAITDAAGLLVEERTHYPFGAVRHLHRPGGALAGTEHDFTGHERDGESGLVHMGARSYLDLAGVFLSPDPRFVRAAELGSGSEKDKQSFTAYLENPQMGNLYAHALRNPLKFIDADGLEPSVSFTRAAAADPTFKLAWKAFAGTKSGQWLLSSIRETGGVVVLDVYRGKDISSITTVDLNGRTTISFGVTGGKAGAVSTREIESIAEDLYDQLREVRDPLAREARMKPVAPYLVPKGVDTGAYIAQAELVARRNALHEASLERQHSRDAFQRELKGDLEDLPQATTE